MADAELVVGARNDAQAVLDEIGESLRGLAVPAQEGSLKADAAISGLVRSLVAGGVAITGVFGAAAIAIGGIAANSAINSIKSETEALDKLNRQLDNYVGAGRLSAEAAKQFAAEMKASLGVSEKDTLSLLEQASSLGVAQEKLDEAALAAIGLSKSLGIDLDSALKKVIEGDDDLVSMIDSVNNGLAEQGKSIEGLAGLWNFLESQTKLTFEFILKATAPIQEMFAGLGKWIKDSILSGIVGAVTAVEVFRDSTAQSLAFAFAAWQYHALQIEEVAKHTFSVALPAYVVWFTDNFTNFMIDGFNAIVVAAMNFTQAIGEAFVALWDFIASGGAGGLEKFTNDLLLATGTLLNGFEATAEQMPKILGRKISEEEQALKAQMNSLGEGLSASFNDKFKRNLDSLKFEVPKLNAGDIQDLQKPKEIEAGKAKNQELRATESRLLTRGRADSVMDKVAQATKDSADRLKSIDENLKNSNNKDKLQLEFVA